MGFEHFTSKKELYKKKAGSLIGPYIQRRLQNPRALKQGVRSALKSLGYQFLPLNEQLANENLNFNQESGNRKRCIFWTRDRDRKTKTFCSNCKFACCSDHQVIMCPSCSGDI